jgi:predicted aspartyl protease
MPPGAPRARPHSAFTCRYQGRSLTLTSPVEIFPAFVLPATPQASKTYKALYDTGATHSTVSPRVVTDLNLAEIGVIEVGVGGGKIITTSHLVNIGLPNKAMFSMVRVASMVVHPDIDALIGMDILGLGDFTVTNHQGKTTFSFCCPSRREIDFVNEIQTKAGRNDPCPCGSGNKYKRCCGKSA